MRPCFAGTKQQSQVGRVKLEGALVQSPSQLQYNELFVDPSPQMTSGYIQRRGQILRTEYEGWLRKQSSSIKKDWKRRWFILKEGQLFYVRSPKDLAPQHVVNVLLCTVKPSQKVDLDFCFDLVSPNKRVYTLQAESQEEMATWYDAHRERMASCVACYK